MRVAILGGGVGALTAAFELTRPERGRAHQVTIYQQGWRLGGKGASARNPACNFRIEEHGLHLWMGCYENAFRVIRDCYAELGRPADAPLSRWDQAFLPQDQVVLMERHGAGWVEWPQHFPVLDSRPGESDSIEHPADLVGGLLRWAVHLLLEGRGEERWAPPAGACRSRLGPLLLGSRGLDDWTGWTLAQLDRALHLLARIFGVKDSAAAQLAHRSLGAGLRTVRRALALAPGRGPADPDWDRLVTTLDFLLTNVIGILAEGFLIPPHGRVAQLRYGDWLRNLERIDHLDYRSWLGRHGARPRTINSCVVRGLGDAVFNSGHAGAAGTALNGLFRLNLTYRGSLFYRMAAGMGETVIAPLYQVLRARGVQFRFFHRVLGLNLGRDGRVRDFDVAVQAKSRGEYRPLFDVPVPGGTLPCWPAHPDYDQLEGGAALEALALDFEAPTPVPGEVVETHRDFEVVVLGISVGALGPLTTELSASSVRWRRMLSELRTTRTQALQLWLDRDFAALGRPGPPAVLTGYAEALDTFADMSHLLKTEAWGTRASAVGYFCGSLDDQGADNEQAQRVERSSAEWLASHGPRILPGLVGRTGLVKERVVSTYHRANVHPSDRYVLSVPGSAAHRLRADDSGFPNLYLAGDWVRTGLNVGSVEAATMAGRRAARAILGLHFPIAGDVD